MAGPAPGHAFPAAALAVALRAAGHEPVVFTGSRWLPALARDGVEGVELPALAPTARDGDFGYLLFERSVTMARPLAGLLGADGVDAVVTDTLTVAGGLAAEIAGVPWVELVPHFLAEPSIALPPPGTGLAPGRGPLGRARDALLRRLAARSWELSARQQAQARATLGLGPSCRAGRLVATLPGLEPARPDWPTDAVVVGPLEWDPADVDLVAPDGDEPLVFVAPSTAGGVDLLRLCLAGLSGVRVAATTLSPYAGATRNWVAVGPGRQAPLLARASVVVSGGGHGIVAKALSRGLPLVVVPGGGDQRDNASRVRRAGAGVVIAPRQVTPDRLDSAVHRVLGGEYAAAAHRVAASAEALGPAYAAETALRMLATRG